MISEKRLSKLQKLTLLTLWYRERLNPIPFPARRGDKKKINAEILREFFELGESTISASMQASFYRSQASLKRRGLIECGRWSIKLTDTGRQLVESSYRDWPELVQAPLDPVADLARIVDLEPLEAGEERLRRRQAPY